MRLKVANLSDLESNLLLLKNDRLVNDLRTSMHLCNNVLKKFIAENSGVEIGASTREIAEVERASLGKSLSKTNFLSIIQISIANL